MQLQTDHEKRQRKDTQDTQHSRFGGAASALAQQKHQEMTDGPMPPHYHIQRLYNSHAKLEYLNNLITSMTQLKSDFAKNEPDSGNDRHVFCLVNHMAPFEDFLMALKLERVRAVEMSAFYKQMVDKYGNIYQQNVEREKLLQAAVLEGLDMEIMEQIADKYGNVERDKLLQAAVLEGLDMEIMEPPAKVARQDEEMDKSSSE